jgi:diketogulonate reductase-like aldo/keto reductase
MQWAKENNLLLEAYSPLGSAEKVKESLQIPEVCVDHALVNQPKLMLSFLQIKEISDSLNITPAQAYISWHVQRGVRVLALSAPPS